ncbi:MAG TPA: lysophospholipid acyltransferase family protein [Longimicrobiaceae bacterium]|nr:lysophospholipid acyltransferase family protein [Longimicrobiaceae bacterium]
MSPIAGDAIRRRIISGAGGALLTNLLRTARFEVSGRQYYEESWGARKPVIFALWHGRLLPCSFFHRNEGLATLISQHRDGDYIAGVVQGWGYRTIRGSSSRGGSAALREIVRTVKRTAIAITPDGPRGPREKVKLGTLFAAQLGKVPIIPVSAGTPRAWWFEGWDRFMVPKPFARIKLIYGAPIEIPRKADQDELANYADLVERELNKLTRLADEG